ncbi:hypothetical protein [Nannocystis pusilla]|uniref:hypothetical protein n=1 Tax=Nannocystis pusilla TaxID=889268 RepID=UPI003B7A0CBF
MTPHDDETEAAHPGRKRDPSRDAKLLEATLEVLAEVGAAGLTMDLVAARAGPGRPPFTGAGPRRPSSSSTPSRT